jgi:hypothetical protein
MLRLLVLVLCSLLSLCANLGASLPYRRGDEPLTVVHHANVLISRRGDDVLSALKVAVAAFEGTDQASHPAQVCTYANYREPDQM